jgi:histone acetyltransferase MYST1
MGYNLACILTFPCVQRTGYGRFLMAFSYELSKKEEKAGSPEKPLSDLGAVGYKSYWANAVLKTLRDYQGQMISVMDITRLTSILPEDVQSTLTMLNLVHNISRVGDMGNAVAITGTMGSAAESGETEGRDASGMQSVLYAPLEHVESLLLKFPEGKLPVQPEKLHWAPLYVMEAKKDKWSIRTLMKDPKDGSNKVDAAAEVVQT